MAFFFVVFLNLILFFLTFGRAFAHQGGGQFGIGVLLYLIAMTAIYYFTSFIKKTPTRRIARGLPLGIICLLFLVPVGKFFYFRAEHPSKMTHFLQEIKIKYIDSKIVNNKAGVPSGILVHYSYSRPALVDFEGTEHPFTMVFFTQHLKLISSDPLTENVRFSSEFGPNGGYYFNAYRSNGFMLNTRIKGPSSDEVYQVFEYLGDSAAFKNIIENLAASQRIMNFEFNLFAAGNIGSSVTGGTRVPPTEIGKFTFKFAAGSP